MMNDLLLLSGGDIPFPYFQTSIHQPRIKEIALMGEDDFFSGCELLKFSKENLDSKAKNSLINYSNFDVIMSMIGEKTIEGQNNKIKLLNILQLLFPDFNISYKNKQLLLEKDDNLFKMDSTSYEALKEIVVKMFCLVGGDAQEYNPEGDLAKKIADKLKQGRQKANKDKGIQKINILNQYVSILAVGQQKDINELMNYTIYQLFDEYERFSLKLSFDTYVQAKMAGAKDLKEVDSWMKNIHE